ncbi:MAG: hypothetical protein ACKVVT_07545 [Dehalococcoidia bacterium]
MILELLANVRRVETDLAARDTAFRQEWEQLQILNRMERALSRARGVLRLLPAQ